MQKITLIAAVANNDCIGIDNRLPWHLPEDFAFFKQYTLGKPIIMGRKTWQSLPRKPLPGRRNIVISRQIAFEADGAEVTNNIDQAIEMCANATEIVIIGGAQIYQESLSIATDLRITEVDLMVDGDAFFPKIDLAVWQQKSKETYSTKEGIEFAFVHYVRK